MIDDKIVHKGLKIKFFLNPSLLGVELGTSKICGLKKVQIWISQVWKENSYIRKTHLSIYIIIIESIYRSS